MVEQPAGASPPPRRGLSRLLPWLVIPLILGALVFEQTRLFRESTCETYDEFTYLRMGICIFRDGDFPSLASPMCPPLPILLEYWLPALQAKFIPGTADWERAVPAMTRQARLLTSVTLGVPLVVLVFAWLTLRRGWIIGAIGGGLLAGSPTFLAAASVATTDACFALFGVVALVGLRHHLARRSRWSYLLAGGGIGLALGSKQSAAIFFVVALVELILEEFPQRRPGGTAVDRALRFGWRVATRWGGLVALAFLVTWGLYGFRLARFGATGTTSTIPVIIPMVANLFAQSDAIMEVVRQYGLPLSYDTFIGQMQHAAQGHAAFLMGAHSRQGWWYFFPVAIAIKSTPAELVALALALGLACRPVTWRDPSRRLWLGASLTLLGAGMASSINIGQRYMLLIYPLAILLAADWLGERAARFRTRAIVAGCLLLTWQGVSAVGIAPHYLSYFNSFCGGPMAGYRYLVDSSLDWGQDLPALRRELEARGYRQVALCYFGTAQAANYGLRAIDWKTTDAAEAARCDYLAISATAVQGAYGTSADFNARFQAFPSTRAGYSIFVYDLKDPRIRAAWDTIRLPSPPVLNESSEPKQ